MGVLAGGSEGGEASQVFKKLFKFYLKQSINRNCPSFHLVVLEWLEGEFSGVQTLFFDLSQDRGFFRLPRLVHCRGGLLVRVISTLVND